MADKMRYMDEVLPCGHKVPLFDAVGGGMVPIANPSYVVTQTKIPAIVWCVEITRSSCGWVSVDDEQYERIKAFRLDTR